MKNDKFLSKLVVFHGVDKRSRTSGLPLRRRSLYPTELYRQMFSPAKAGEVLVNNGYALEKALVGRQTKVSHSGCSVASASAQAVAASSEENSANTAEPLPVI